MTVKPYTTTNPMTAKPYTNHITAKNIYHEIDFVGWKNQEEVYKLLKDSRALIFPSRWYEGFPLTIMEALTMNVPCIISDCTSATEIIKDGINGFIFENKNLDSAIISIRKMLDDNIYSTVFENTQITHSSIISNYNISYHVIKLLENYNT